MERAESRRLRIKAATRDLVAACGGVERSAEIADYSKTEVSRWQTATAMSSVIPVDAILTLEAECGLALVTSAMAAINGRQLTAPEEATPASASLMAQMSNSMVAGAKAARVFAEIIEDGVTTDSELDRLQRALGEKAREDQDLQNVVSSLRADALRVVGGSDR